MKRGLSPCRVIDKGISRFVDKAPGMVCGVACGVACAVACAVARAVVAARSARVSGRPGSESDPGVGGPRASTWSVRSAVTSPHSPPRRRTTPVPDHRVAGPPRCACVITIGRSRSSWRVLTMARPKDRCHPRRPLRTETSASYWCVADTNPVPVPRIQFCQSDSEPSGFRRAGMGSAHFHAVTTWNRSS